ncbi:MAG TPA: 3-oxoadipate enol-lactonase [Streptosporangiaceae bacterium]|nr:3-oxoadipate enol-lactonase [Streptosporangiaceae bacterium]
MTSLPELTASLDGPPGAPVLVLGNSLGTSRMVWDRQVPALGERFRLLRYELPGHDGAPARPGPYTVGVLASGVLGLLDSYGVDRAAYCGISLGGMIGMWLAAHAPDRVSALGLVCSSAYLPPADGWRARADLVCRDGMTAITQASIGRWFTPEFAAHQPALMSSFAAEFERVDPVGYAGCCMAIAGMDLRECLGSVRAPTLVVSGARDPATPPEHGAAIAAGIAGARHVVLSDAAHLANVSSPEEVTGVLVDHLGREPMGA